MRGAPTSVLLVALLFLSSSWEATAVSGSCSGKSTKYLAANKDTVRWGFYDLSAPYVAHVKPGDTITVEVVTHTAGADYSKIIKGDKGLEGIFKWGTGKTAGTKSVPKPPGSGSHIVTGPIEVCGAEVGDVIQVDILSMKPRPNPRTKKTYGVNVLTNFGYHYVHAEHRDGTPFKGNASTITVYEIKYDRPGRYYYGDPIYQFLMPALTDPGGTTAVITTQPIGYTVPHAIDVGGTGLPVTYPEGFKFVVANDSSIKYTSASLDYRIPLRPHIGIMAVMPANGQLYLNGAINGTKGASTVSPSNFGGNIDNWRIGPGTTMYYKAQVAGGRLVLADTHAAQGDSELSGTAIETCFTVKIRVKLLKLAKLPSTVRLLNFPLGETRYEYMIHGFVFLDYLSQLTTPSNISLEGGSLDLAFKGAYDRTRNFLMDAFYLAETEAIGVMSTSVDFIVTQVVDSNWGVHGLVKKFVFGKRTKGRKLLEYMGDPNFFSQLKAREAMARRRQKSLLYKLWN
eukprot:jgi/Mesen1/4966/ME000248S04250